MACNSTCKEDRPDAVRRDNMGRDGCCEEMPDSGCSVPEMSCCPINLDFRCVLYSGCKTFEIGANPGDNLHDVLMKIEDLFRCVDEKFQRQQEEINLLKNELDSLKNDSIRKEGCDVWE